MCQGLPAFTLMLLAFTPIPALGRSPSPAMRDQTSEEHWRRGQRAPVGLSSLPSLSEWTSSELKSGQKYPADTSSRICQQLEY